ncbi:MAG TPA: phosphoribosylaminoimidazolesuccinocarboxamide synthase [Acidimicrobiales bacterium]|nr:phosphoribosylaminoimidazolesuccinocarboxamide synthase [Acidimicrobiales bacterium]
MTINLPHTHSGKVRDIYDAGDSRLLMVTSDRISAFDVVMNETVVHKGRVLTAMSAFWFEQLSPIVNSHLISTDVADIASLFSESIPSDLEGRIMLCNKAEMLPIECIVRGYITGSAWKEYCASETMHGSPLPADLKEADQLPEPVFTPSTKAEEGHDINISFEEAAALIGDDLAEEVKKVSLQCYIKGAELAKKRGIIIADTKFEMGIIDGNLVLADEVLTPDSSRFWSAELWQPGSTPPSFDKQPVRDYLDGLDWDKQPPPPSLPSEVTESTSQRYIDAFEIITGQSFSNWPGSDGVKK